MEGQDQTTTRSASPALPERRSSTDPESGQDLIRSDEESAEFTPGGSVQASSDSSSDNSSAEPDKRTANKYNEETANLLDELRDTMETSQKDFVFACGGSIPFAADTTTAAFELDDSGVTHSPPVSLRWDPRDPSTSASQCKLTFPLDTASPDQQQQRHQGLVRLVGDMDKATFGLGGEDVYDESYRRAVKLDTSRFSTSFCPYDVGIMDTITSILVPGLNLGGADRIARAELYKLNVYEGPSGFFNVHVDTPRSPSQFGSLVVCLPAPHTGGELQLRHNGRTMTFDWSSSSSEDKIQWAAFYSDVTHAVLPVTSGHRVTLTYNLYSHPNPSQLPSPTSPLPSNLSLPLITHMSSLLSNPSFMPSGGYLGFYTTHAYPHTSLNFSVSALKGIDMVIFRGFQSLGCGVCLRPILDPECYFWNDTEDTIKPVIGKFLPMCAAQGRVEAAEDMQYIFRDEDWGWVVEEAVNFEDVEWLNEGMERHREMQLAYTVYGNEANTAAQYSWCAILIGVPGWDEEKGARGRLERTFEEREVGWK
ncbi:hypothetical protein C8A03DRAFT_33125 [Achaetomium macrosporum]|uniref:Fe2OG dioxygenase domain-containing protein n=1 Tax=Achaetomium macrosporum TaxID=79813 RepID=A0AAN7H7J3_9PEZI|nr:hypothetical protein C8A03DRAFT_33125 [Achaetomium macrosporum]